MVDNICKKATKTLWLFVLATFIHCGSAQAKICFLPGGVCPETTAATSVRAVQGDQCLGYNLTQVKCKDQACETGWECESCTNAQGTFYKCAKKPVPEGCTAGLEKCPSPCQKYTQCGFSGNQITAKCEDIADYTSVKPSPCKRYVTPDYVCGAVIDGAVVSDVTMEAGDCPVCYTNIVDMEGYTTNKPASCTTYNSKRNGVGTSDDLMCYTTGVSIGENFSTAVRDSDAFIVETKYGVNTFIDTNGSQTKKNTEACYRATACNTAKGWLNSTDVDGNKFEYLEKTSDGLTCRKAIGCRENNQWFNIEKLGQFKDKYFAVLEETRSGITCYNATGCHPRAYPFEPDTKYFTSDKKTSNGKDCWIVTGKAEFAYDDTEKQPDHFEYDEGKEAYLNATDETVKYYLVNNCSQYSYNTKPDEKYFTSDSVTQKKSGTNVDLTCWNITGKADFAYEENEKEPNFFAYDAGKEGYLNGTPTKVKHYIALSCNTPYSYTQEPDARYFASVAVTQKQSGTNIDLTCWNITGKGEFAYTESEKKPNFFAYDNGKEGYLNGTASTARYFDITQCGMYAYSSEPDKGYFTSEKDTKKKGGIDEDITCWIATGKAQYTYDDAEKKTNFFDYDSSTAYMNGTATQATYHHAKKCSPYAYESEPDAKYFSYTKETQKKNGTNSDLTCWNITGKGKYAYTEAEKNPLYFTYDAGKEGYLNGTSTKGKYFNATALADGAYPTSPDTKIFTVNKAEAYKGGVDNIVPSWRAVGCNGANNYSATKPDARFFASTNSTASGITCYIATGCASGITSSKPSGCKTWNTASTGSIVCYYNIATPQKPVDYERCGTCGYHTRSVTCDDNGGGWNTAPWGGCVEAYKEPVSQGCGCGGTQTRSATCSVDGKSWTYGDWGNCSSRDCTGDEECVNGKCVAKCNGTLCTGHGVEVCLSCPNRNQEYDGCLWHTHSKRWTCWECRTTSDCNSNETCQNHECVQTGPSSKSSTPSSSSSSSSSPAPSSSSSSSCNGTLCSGHGVEVCLTCPNRNQEYAGCLWHTHSKRWSCWECRSTKDCNSGETCCSHECVKGSKC